MKWSTLAGFPGSTRVAAALLSTGLLTACNGLPSDGPGLSRVMGSASTSAGRSATPSDPLVAYAVVTLDPVTVDALVVDEAGSGFSALATDTAQGSIRLGVGDVLSVTIFESQSGGLFVPLDAGSRPGNYVTLPAQQIDREGNISVPFGGSVRAAGRTPAQLESTIARLLARRALEPQVIVSLADRRSSSVSVLGEVSQSVRFNLDPGGERLLGAIARAGGTRFPAYETLVTLQRTGRVERAMLSDILADPNQNLFLRPDDTIVLTREQRYFLALGALGQTTAMSQINRRIAFEERRLTLADAVAKAGGLQNDRANPEAVFVFRFEEHGTLARMGIDTRQQTGTMPTIYRADFSNPGSLFLAQRFPVRHNDLLFVSNAPSTDLQKLLQLMLPAAQVGSNVRAIFR